MFNGMIKEIAEVVKFDGKNLRLRAKFRPNLGDSIAVNGACLSVSEIFFDGFCVQVSSESSANIATKNFKNRVHIEPAMRLGDRIDGHLLQGHVDFIGEISRINHLKVGTDFFIKLPHEAMKFMAKKGSVGVDGVSLTINDVLDDEIRLTIIPITLETSLFGEFSLGRSVNIESDLLARYAERILNFSSKNTENKTKELTWDDVERISSLY